MFIAAGQLACTVASFFIDRIQRQVSDPLNARIRRWWALHCFHAHARLDYPTFTRSDVKRQLGGITENYWGQSVIWCTLELLADLISVFTRLIAQALVLVQVLRGQHDGPLLAVLTLASEGLVHAANLPIFKPARGESFVTALSRYVCSPCAP